MQKYVKFIDENSVEEAPKHRADLGICNYNLNVELMLADGYFPLDETEKPTETKVIPFYVKGKKTVIRKYKETSPVQPIELNEEQMAAQVRTQRNLMLQTTDWTMCRDVHLSEKVEAAYIKYRQELRDITEQEGFLYNVVYPILDLKDTENE